jgi:hypothetical protein
MEVRHNKITLFRGLGQDCLHPPSMMTLTRLLPAGSRCFPRALGPATGLGPRLP